MLETNQLSQLITVADTKTLSKAQRNSSHFTARTYTVNSKIRIRIKCNFV